MKLPSKSVTFGLLMALSAVSALLLPREWTGWVRGPFQTLGLAQWMTTRTVRSTTQLAESTLGPRVSVEQARQLTQENEALRAQVINQELALEQLERTLEDATGLREQLPGSHVVLVLAPVIGHDADPKRETLLIALNERTYGLVQKGQWVAAGLRQTPTREGLFRQWLIGKVADVQTRLARIQLTTDPRFREGVQMARMVAGPAGNWSLEVAPTGVVMDGRGGGEMLISQSPRDFQADGFDLVVAPTGGSNPLAMIVGRVEDSRRRDDSAKHFDLTVEPWGEVAGVTHVYVITTP